MESIAITNLIELLKSQLALYENMRDLLAEEKNAATGFNNHKALSEINAQKEQLSKKEKLLEEARKTLSLRMQRELDLPEPTILAIIEAYPESLEKTRLIELRDALLAVTAEISAITASLKIFYATNLKIINEIKSKIGFAPSNKYGMEKSMVSLPASLRITG